LLVGGDMIEECSGGGVLCSGERAGGVPWLGGNKEPTVVLLGGEVEDSLKLFIRNEFGLLEC
jgi:hypothetical protein